MVQRQFAAFDNEAFTVSDSSPRLTPGSSIINNSSTPRGTIFEFTGGFEYQPITLDDTSSEPDIFNDDEEGQHVIVDGRGLVADGTEVESESYHFLRALDDNGNPTGPTITVTVFSQNGNTSDIWGMASDTELQTGVRYVKTGGSNNGDSEYESFVPCFTPGAMVSTPAGLIRVENLKVGDRVMTRDNGLQDIHWIGRKDLTLGALTADARLRPIRISKGALGDGMPMTDMMVSPNHRMLITGPELAMNFGEEEMLVAAKHLVGLPGVQIVEACDVSYIHLLCERHEVLMVDAVWTESFQPGEYAMNGLASEQSDEVFSLFPELRNGGLNLQFRDARTAMRAFEAQIAKEALSA
ncbi:Hint domain-containing protein [Octadecabacter sp. G9-8]|uniref:Hint domain-containing protein n=1 Tax=Octadecabacter dasysiphoniae TaxID=2909341 RepID=A0ABS9CTC8_9RHOB|nr:Hint domain-containing protein [Octadecabacter dasysiphoniae]MCF2870462.1 Hint domain-containing protein [Octadecabacter dasysiphoniae]